MTLRLPTVADPRIQQALNRISRAFPIGHEHLRTVFVEKVASLPESGEAGQLAFNEEDNKLYCHNGTEWKATF